MYNETTHKKYFKENLILTFVQFKYSGTIFATNIHVPYFRTVESDKTFPRKINILLEYFAKQRALYDNLDVTAPVSNGENLILRRIFF
jgi:hypothetical protein